MGKKFTTIKFTHLEFPVFLASCIRNDEQSMKFTGATWNDSWLDLNRVPFS